MGLIDYLIIGAIVLIIGAATFYIIRTKKSGQKCVGCPDSKTCGGSCAGCSAGCSSKCGTSNHQN